MSDLLQLIQNTDEVESTVKKYDGRIHQYILNQPGLYLIMALAGVAYIAAAILWIGGFTDSLGAKIGLGVALLIGTACSLTVTYWNSVGQKKFVATSEDKLMIGDSQRLWVIDWSILDVEKLGLKDMELSRAGGRLEVHAAGEVIPLLLFSPFAMLADPQEFILAVLTHTATDEALAAAEEEDESSEPMA